MRVISGSLKGRIIKGHDIVGTRPTMDRVKESMFASIQDHLSNSVVLDLFAGSGNLGIEAVSNGASLCYFVDNNRECIKIIKENINNFSIESNCQVLSKDYLKALEYFRDKGIKFDVILVDPPYKYMIMEEILELVYEYNLLSIDGVIVLEYQDDVIGNVSSYYELLKHKKYGDKYVSIYALVEIDKNN